MMMLMFAVLFFAAGPVRPAGSRGNDDTREEAAGKTRRVSSGARRVSIVDQATGLRGRRFSPAPPPVRHGRTSQFFPVRDLR